MNRSESPGEISQASERDDGGAATERPRKWSARESRWHWTERLNAMSGQTFEQKRSGFTMMKIRRSLGRQSDKRLIGQKTVVGLGVVGEESERINEEKRA